MPPKKIPAPLGIEEPTPAEPQQVQEQKPLRKIERNFSGVRKQALDCFKLGIANALKRSDRSFRVDEVETIEKPHLHFHRSNERNGSRAGHCSYILGHAHPIIAEYDSEGLPVLETIRVGEPVRQSTKSKNGASVQTLVPVILGTRDGENVVDRHTHQIEYLKTQEQMVRL